MSPLPRSLTQLARAGEAETEGSSASSSVPAFACLPRRTCSSGAASMSCNTFPSRKKVGGQSPTKIASRSARARESLLSERNVREALHRPADSASDAAVAPCRSHVASGERPAEMPSTSSHRAHRRRRPTPGSSRPPAPCRRAFPSSRRAGCRAGDDRPRASTSAARRRPGMPGAGDTTSRPSRVEVPASRSAACPRQRAGQPA
jgi:hypothetical protein